MLVVTRRSNEGIVIGDGIEVRVLRIGKAGVRLGISAPADVPVHRREVYDSVCASNRAAAATDAEVRELRERLVVLEKAEPARSGR